MALENQIHIYSVDTGNFFTKKERRLHNKITKIKIEEKQFAVHMKEKQKKLSEYGYSCEDIKKIHQGKLDEIELLQNTLDFIREYTALLNISKIKANAAGSLKDKLSALLFHKVNAKEQVNQNKRKNYSFEKRRLDDNTITEKHIISLFESSLTRMLGLKKDRLSEDILVIQVYYFDIFKDISYYGFTYKGEAYRYYTSSAGQIREKKAVFIKESIWNRYEKTIMCGLTIDKINRMGGNNVNKHLAYMALTNSATDEWPDFDIDRTIVIDDFETNVFGEYDLIDDSDYSITRRKGEVPVTHTDGAGMALSGKNRMFRAPWIKGLLGIFDFRTLILQWREQYHNHSIGIVKDIYGKEHDIIAEDISVIFTKSQFKMYKYYDSWEEYKEYFKKYHCKAGVCNVEEDRIPNSKFNYQELQTLTAITEEDLKAIAAPSVNKLQNLCSSITAMQRAFGVSPYNTNMTSLQEAVKLYPNLMNDSYLKDILKGIKDNLIKKYKSAKLEIEGKYTFLLPDFYAACEFWFLGNKNPGGLLADGKVWCSLLKHREELDCLRSPHLYKEHAVRENAANTETKEQKEFIAKWFCTNAIYTSCHDLISKILQFDVDGDRSLVIGDKKIVEIAKRSMRGVVPLYYNMRKAEPTELNHVTIYNGLIAAFTGSNIGTYSNHITKIWNSDIFINGTDEEKRSAENVVKLLCMENNFCIDYAKTLYKPKRPKEMEKKIKEFTGKKVPYFFIYAKDKDISQVESKNNSIVNQLEDIIPNPRINTRKIGLEDIDYRLLMHSTDTQIDKAVIKKYTEFNTAYHFKISMKDEYQNNLHYLACQIREELSGFGYADIEVADMLVKYLYEKKNRKAKDLLWFCYGKYIVENLKQHITLKKTKAIQCIDCGEWLEIDNTNNRTCRCSSCQSVHNRKLKTKKQQEYRRQPVEF